MKSEISESQWGAERRRGLLALCLVVGAAVMVQGAARLPCISRDGVFFVEYAQKLATEPLVQLRGQTKQPGYSILLLGLHSWIGRSISEKAAVSWEVCGQIIAVLGGVAVVGLIYLLTRRLFDARTGLVAALLAVFWPQLVTVSSDVLSDAPHLALYLGGLLLGVKAMGAGKRRKVETSKRRNEDTESADGADGRKLGAPISDLGFQNGGMRWGALVACGAVCGAGYWLRQEALGAAAAVVICLLWPTEGVSLRRRIARAGVIVAAFAMVVAPYSIAVGKVMPNKSIKDLLWGAEETKSADGADQRRWESQISDLRFQKREAIQQAGPVTWWDAPVKMLGGWSRSGRYVLSTLALVGFFWPRAARSERGVRRFMMIAALLQIIAAQARGMQYGVVSERYLIIPAGLSIPWSAAGLVALARWGAERIGNSEWRIAKGGARVVREANTPSRSSVGWRSLTVAALMAIGTMAYYDLRPAEPGADWQREAGAWIAERASPGDVVNAAHQHAAVAFYAGLERRWPVGADVAKAMKSGGAVWVVDDPGMSRMTAEEHVMVAEYRKHLRADLQSEAWRTEGGSEVKVFKLRK